MNKDYTFYNSATGIISFNVSCSEEVLASLIEKTTDSWAEGIYPKEEYYVLNNVFISIPPQPAKGYFFNYNTKDWEVNLIYLADSIKQQRQQLLQESDWTDTVSAQTRLGPELYNSWQVYRQALRDITVQDGFPLAVNWPQAPV